MAGVWMAVKLARRRSIYNALGVALLYALFAYLLSQSPSNLENAYPQWFVIVSYVILLPAALLGHVMLGIINKEESV